MVIKVLEGEKTWMRRKQVSFVLLSSADKHRRRADRDGELFLPGSGLPPSSSSWRKVAGVHHPAQTFSEASLGLSDFLAQPEKVVDKDVESPSSRMLICPSSCQPLGGGA